MTSALLKSCNKKSRLYLKYLRNPTAANKLTFTAYRNKFKHLRVLAEKIYFAEKLPNINLVYSCIVTTMNYYHQILITNFVKVYPYTNTIQGIPATIGVILLVQKSFLNTLPQELTQAPIPLASLRLK